MAKYSRSSRSIKETIDELAEEKSAEFHEKWVLGYGDASVADMAIVAIAQKLILQKHRRAHLTRGKRDIHERDVRLRHRVITKYRELACIFPHTRVVECAPAGKLLSMPAAHQRVLTVLRGVL